MFKILILIFMLLKIVYAIDDEHNFQEHQTPDSTKEKYTMLEMELIQNKRGEAIKIMKIIKKNNFDISMFKYFNIDEENESYLNFLTKNNLQSINKINSYDEITRFVDNLNYVLNIVIPFKLSISLNGVDVPDLNSVKLNELTADQIDKVEIEGEVDFNSVGSIYYAFWFMVANGMFSKSKDSLSFYQQINRNKPLLLLWHRNEHGKLSRSLEEINKMSSNENSIVYNWNKYFMITTESIILDLWYEFKMCEEKVIKTEDSTCIKMFYNEYPKRNIVNIYQNLMTKKICEKDKSHGRRCMQLNEILKFGENQK